MRDVQRVLVVDLDLCTGCGLCELACSFEKTKEFSRVNSRIRVFTWPETAEYVPLLCWQCNPAPCMEACGVPGAMKRDPKTGAVIIDESKCIRCKVCMAACPYGGIALDRRGAIVKCDYCEGEPKCAEICPRNAIIWARPYEASNVIKRIFADKLKVASKGPAGPLRP